MILFGWVLPLFAENAKEPFLTCEEKPYLYELAIGTIFRNDAKYLKEWIEFHRLLGVDHFFLYNHLSDDDFLTVLTPYVEKKIVEIVEWNFPFEKGSHEEWIQIQCGAYNDILQKHREECKWIVFLDSDEFLFPTQKESLPQFLKEYEAFGGLCVSWRLYGTSHIMDISSDEWMIEKLIMAAPETYHVFHKSIVNPRRVKEFKNAHAATYHAPFFHVDAHQNRIEEGKMQSEAGLDLIRINHYWTRDESYFVHHKLNCRNRRGWSLYHDLSRLIILNECYDPSILRFLPKLQSFK